MSNCNMHRCGVADFKLCFYLGIRSPWAAFERLIENTRCREKSRGAIDSGS